MTRPNNGPDPRFSDVFAVLAGAVRDRVRAWWAGRKWRRYRKAMPK